MITPLGPWEAFPTGLVEADDATGRAHDQVRRTLTHLLAAATPRKWEVLTGGRCTSATESVDLDIAVRPRSYGEASTVPLLCIDLAAGVLAAESPRLRARLRCLAQLGVDHYWSLDTVAAVLDVWIRVDREYRHAETVSEEDWLDYGVGIIRLDVRRLLEA